MNDDQKSAQGHCCGIGGGWRTVLWIVIGLLGLAALSALPSLLSATLSEAGIL